ncbi:epididymal-specific lipocalin-8 [Microtus ochrogaster]|uniref:Epididymal-specific lipocalin-8 n=1 Tax=Microtus ochrogaster TaxID=79684 RepID=A0ABM1AZ50_MICOH|nr:epididymal-specific lipocalin-8 [Microtus ochrogaster]
MEARLLRTVWGLFLLYLLQAESASSVDLVPEKIAGFWKEVAVTSEQNLVLKTQRRVEGLFLTFSGRNITVKAVYNSSGSCMTETSVGSGRDTVGEFAFPGQRKIYVLDTDYEHYTILKLSLLWQGRNFHVLKYFTRSLETEDEPGFWRFREMTADQGLYMLTRHGRCAELLRELVRWRSALLDILGFPVSNTIRIHYLHNLTVTAHTPEVDTITHFADRDSQAQGTSALPKSGNRGARDWSE